MLEVLGLCRTKSWTIAASEVIEVELLRMKDAGKQENVMGLYESAAEYLVLTSDIKRLAKRFQRQGIMTYNSLHLATAEINGYTVLLTTDDDFCRAAYRLALTTRVCNSVEWLLEEFENDANSWLS